MRTNNMHRYTNVITFHHFHNFVTVLQFRHIYLWNKIGSRYSLFFPLAPFFISLSFFFLIQIMSKPSPLAAKIAGSILPFVVYGLLGYTWYIYIFRICGKFI